ncbi:MAG: hypothetical protein KGY70_19100 [Bacteroidales bacterium]|nr:hypothetical protein [Bacteroidales bacterium]
MKHLIFIIVLLAATLSVNAQKLGFGIHAGSNSGLKNNIALGISPQLFYKVDTSITLNTNLIYYFLSDRKNDEVFSPESLSTKTYLYQLNANINYFPYKNFYIVVGGNYSKVSSKASYYQSVGKYSKSKIGYNIGIGLKMNNFYIQTKYDNSIDQLTLSLSFHF